MTDKTNADSLDMDVDQSGDYDPAIPGSAPHMADAPLVSELTEVEVPEGTDPADTASALLAAAEDLGYNAGIVQAFDGNFIAPQDVVEAAFPGQSDDSDAPKKAPAKKAPAKTARK